MPAVRVSIKLSATLPYKVTIPDRLSNDRIIGALQTMWAGWLAWFDTDEADGLWCGQWTDRDGDYVMAFSHLPTATAFKLRFC